MGSTTKTETQNKDPWAPAQPYLTDMMSQAQNLYRSGAGSQTWGGPNVAPTDPTLQMAFNGMQGLSGADLSGGFNTGNQVMSMTAPAINQLSDVASGRNAINTSGMWGDIANTIGPMANQDAVTTGGGWADMYNRAGNMNADPNSVFGRMAHTDAITTGAGYGQAGRQAGAIGNQYGGGVDRLAEGTQGQNQDVYGTLGGVGKAAGGPTAADRYLPGMADSNGTNPYFQQMLAANDARTANRVNSTFSGAGRFGSGGHTDVLARTLAETDNAANAQQFDAEQQRKLAATGQIDAARLGYGNQGIQAATALGGQRNLDTNMQGTLLSQGYGIRSGSIGQGMQALQGLTGVQGQNAAQRFGAAGALADSNRADFGAQANALTNQGGVQAQNSGLRQGAVGLGINAAQGLGNVQNQNIQNQANAANSMVGAGVQYANMMPQLNAMRYGDANQLANIGNFNQSRADQNLAMQQALFQQQQQMPWSQLQRYAGLTGPMGGLGGTTTGSTATPFNPISLLPAAPMFL